jgi:acyl-CoA synthetase (NDP forming)
MWNSFENTPLVARISSPDIAHKSDVGGVMLDVRSKAESIKSYNKILENIKKHEPKALIY